MSLQSTPAGLEEGPGYDVAEARKLVEGEVVKHPRLVVTWEPAKEPLYPTQPLRTDLEGVVRIQQAARYELGIRIQLTSTRDTTGKPAGFYKIILYDERPDVSESERTVAKETTKPELILEQPGRVGLLTEALSESLAQAMFRRYRDLAAEPWQKFLPVGNVPPVTTPFIRGTDGLLRVDRESARRHFELLRQMGIKAVFLVGTTGEFFVMDRQLRQDAIRVLTEEASKAGLIPWVNITGGPGPTLDQVVGEIVENAEIAQALGAKVLVLVPLYYLLDTEEGVPHLRKLKGVLTSRRVNLPLGLYNITMLQRGKNLPADAIATLAQEGTIVVVKDTSLQPALTQAYIRTGAVVYTGDNTNPLGVLEAGARGVVGIMANLLKADADLPVAPPEERPALLEQVRSLFPIVAGSWNDLHLQSGAKYALQKMGIYRSDEVVNPTRTRPLSDEKNERQAIDAILPQLGPNPVVVPRPVSAPPFPTVTGLEQRFELVEGKRWIYSFGKHKPPVKLDVEDIRTFVVVIQESPSAEFFGSYFLERKTARNIPTNRAPGLPDLAKA